MTAIKKGRREWFGGIVYSESPAFTAFVDSNRADLLGIPSSDNLLEGLYSAPLDVHMSITNRCNLSCKGCYARTHDVAIKDMPVELACAIIDRLSSMNVFTIAMGGGEPFLHPHVFDIAAYAREKEIVPNITTNGVVMDSEAAHRCQVFGSVHISCHDPSELPRLVNPVRNLKRAGIDIGVNVLVSAESYASLPQIWGWCANEGVSRILLLKFKLTENNHECDSMLLSIDQERSIMPLIRQLSRRHSIMPMLDCSFFPALACNKPDRKDLDFFDVNGCLGGNAILAITSDGQFKPCSFCHKTYGNALSLSLNAWRENRELSKFRSQRLHSSCYSCDYEDLCNGGCRISETRCCQ